MTDAHVRLKFWGVRGSTPTPQIENLKFGGNTPCLEIRTPENECVIFDAGSGIRALGQTLIQEADGAPINTRIFLTHFHWDHIQGIPFFAPLFAPKNHITFFSGSGGQPLRETLEGQMAKPYFPIDFGQVAAKRDFHQLENGGEVETGGLRVRPFPLNHPQGASGYRIEAKGATIVYATDYEHGVKESDDILREYAQDADILICDAQYTPAEYELHRGWGHSTWENAVCLAKQARAKHLMLFHHDPTHDDQTMMRISQDARVLFENTTAAWEGFSAIL
ncbi:MAG TPA: MBL fold metallo-hydrolase [Bryobacteraceae bacterium]|jgi:phosphoribosyl 1,2-cyclic phosphodiesterase